MKLDWKPTDKNDGWTQKPYETARAGKLLFRLLPRRRGTTYAAINIAHDDIVGRPYADPDCNSTPTFIYKSMSSTRAAREYAESFDYTAWRSNEVETAKADRREAKKTLAQSRRRVREAKSLPADA